MRSQILASASKIVLLEHGVPLRDVVVRRIVEWDGGGTNRSALKTNHLGEGQFEAVHASRLWHMLGFRTQFRQRIFAHVDGQEIQLLSLVKDNLDDLGEFDGQKIRLRVDIAYPLLDVVLHGSNCQIRGELVGPEQLCSAS